MKKITLGLVLLAVAVLSYGTPGPVSEITVQGRTSGAIQEAINQVGSGGGGTVFLPSGNYALNSAIRLTSNLVLKGEGRATVLSRVPYVKSALLKDAEKGDNEVWVENTDGFEEGMEVVCWDTENFDSALMEHAWAIIKRVDKDRVVLDRNLPYSYLIKREAMLTNAFYGIHGENVKGVTIMDLVIDGALKDSEREFVLTAPGAYGTGFDYRAGHQRMGIQFTDCLDCTVSNCMVYNCGSNGISCSGGENIRFLGCDSHHNGWHGYHLGLSKTGATRCVMQDCRAHHNSMVGIYICWNVLESVFIGNHVTDNTGDGILIGPYDTRNIISNNVISRNGGCGIIAVRRAFSGESNLFTANIICDNGVPGKTPAIWIQSPEEGAYQYYYLSGNMIIETREIGISDAPAIYIDEQTDHITVLDNIVQGKWRSPVEDHSKGKNNRIRE